MQVKSDEFFALFSIPLEKKTTLSLPVISKQCPVQDEPERLNAEHTTAYLRPVAE